MIARYNWYLYNLYIVVDMGTISLTLLRALKLDFAP